MYIWNSSQCRNPKTINKDKKTFTEADPVAIKDSNDNFTEKIMASNLERQAIILATKGSYQKTGIQ